MSRYKVGKRDYRTYNPAVAEVSLLTDFYMQSKILFKILLGLFAVFLLLAYIPIVFANQIAVLAGYNFSLILDGGLGDYFFKLVLPVYVVLFLSTGIGYKISKNVGNIISFVWGLILLGSMIALVW